MQIRGFIATSLEGYISRLDGSIDWLDDFADLDYGYDEFITQIQTVVIGRRTFDQLQELSSWPYEGKKAIVVSHRPLEALPPDGELWQGDIADLVARLRQESTGDVQFPGRIQCHSSRQTRE